MSMKDDIIKTVTDFGPKNDAELVRQTGHKSASLRRARLELVEAGKLVATEHPDPGHCNDGPYWAIGNGKPIIDIAKKRAKKAAANAEIKPQEAAANPKKERGPRDPAPVPAEKKDWRNTPFTF